MQTKQAEYSRFTSRSGLEKSINTLMGLVEGIVIDGVINSSEVGLLNMWLAEHRELQEKHPYIELFPVLEKAIATGVLETEEQQDILWLCEKLQSNDHIETTTASLQMLHGILGGIAADGLVTKEELSGLSNWLANHEDLRTCWPYDEVVSLVAGVMADGKIDDNEQKLLQRFFSEFISILDDRTITSPLMSMGTSVEGVCASRPEINFEGSTFCFTGASNRYSREEFEQLIESLGGKAASSVSKKVDYLVIGAEGNQCWAYACYGRKVEKAVELRKEGVKILIIHENDFHAAIANIRSY